MGQDQETSRATKDSLGQRYIAFLLGEEQYALPLLQVKEVIEMTEPTPIPKTPHYFKGVINLRGQVISVIDLRTKLGLESADKGPKTAIIILDLPGMSGTESDRFGIVVDRVYSVVSFEEKDFSEPPMLPEQKSQQGSASFVTRVAKKDDKLIVILNLSAVLSAEGQVIQIPPELKTAPELRAAA